jgi:hypothetical protein
VSDAGRGSLCHRHEPEYEEPAVVYRKRLGVAGGESSPDARSRSEDRSVDSE